MLKRALTSLFRFGHHSTLSCWGFQSLTHYTLNSSNLSFFSCTCCSFPEPQQGKQWRRCSRWPEAQSKGTTCQVRRWPRIACADNPFKRWGRHCSQKCQRRERGACSHNLDTDETGRKAGDSRDGPVTTVELPLVIVDSRHGRSVLCVRARRERTAVL